MRGFLLALALTSAAVVAEAQTQGAYAFKPGRLSEPEAITKALAALPFNDKAMAYKHLGERFERIGLKATQIDVERLTAQDEKDAPDQFKRGDIHIRVFIAQASAPVQAICPLGNVFQVIKRGARWIPQDRTANWLINGHGYCKAPA